MKALPKILLALTGVAALSLAYPASVQAVPTTYQYTGHHFTNVRLPYTTSDFVTAMVTLADPLPSNFHGDVTPTAFTISDGEQTITNNTPHIDAFFEFTTNARGEIALWFVEVDADLHTFINTIRELGPENQTGDNGLNPPGFGANAHMPGVWRPGNATPDTGSTLSLMTLTLMALGLVARRFQRAAG